jgi:hypothetical protein
MVCDDGPFPNGRLKVHMLGCDAAGDHLERGDLPAWFTDNLSTYAVFRQDVE